MIEVERAGGVRKIALNRPEKRNALNAAMCGALADALDDADGDDSVGAILLTANGPAFCAGMDLEEALTAGAGELAEVHERLFTFIDRSRKPVVAAVEGAALGGGMGLAVNAHIVVASGAARFGLTEIRIGLWPVLIMRAVILAIGERRATELSLTGRVLDAREARDYGLAAEVAEEARRRAGEIAEELAGRAGQAVREGLAYTRGLRGRSWSEAATMGGEVRERLMASSDFRTRAGEFVKGRSLPGKPL